MIGLIAILILSATFTCNAAPTAEERIEARRATIIEIKISALIDNATQNGIDLGDLAFRSEDLPSKMHLLLLLAYYYENELALPHDLRILFRQ